MEKAFQFILNGYESLPMQQLLTIENIEQMQREDLSLALNHLIETDFNALVYLLYRIDINEAKMKQALDNRQQENAGVIIADLVIERLQQKAILKKQFPLTDDINEEEKW